MDCEMVRARLEKRFHVALRMLDHQLDVQRTARHPVHRLHNHGTKADIRHEMPVHDVQVQPIRSRLLDGFDLLGQSSEITGQETRGNHKLSHQ